MKLVLFTGSRDWTDIDAVAAVFDRLDPRLHVVVEGGHRDVLEWIDGYPIPRWPPTKSADHIARHIANERFFAGYTFPAPWDQVGKRAGRVRNEHMARLRPWHTFAFPLPESKGTWHMIGLIRKAGLPLSVWTPQQADRWPNVIEDVSFDSLPLETP